VAESGLEAAAERNELNTHENDLCGRNRLDFGTVRRISPKIKQGDGYGPARALLLSAPLS
jgi:hypothetical protein